MLLSERGTEMFDKIMTESEVRCDEINRFRTVIAGIIFVESYIVYLQLPCNAK
jgi:hypothetical protein